MLWILVLYCIVLYCIVLYYIVSIHLYSASCSANQSEALPLQETQKEESRQTKTNNYIYANMLPFQLYIPDLYKSSSNNNNLTTEIQKRSRVEHLLSSPFDVGFALFHKQRLLVKIALLVDQANVVDI